MILARVALGVALMTGAPSFGAAQGAVDLDGRPVNPLKVPQGTRAHVLVFTTTDCPISNRYAPEIRRLNAAFADRGVVFWLVYPVPGDGPEKIGEHVATFGYHMPVARDRSLDLVRALGPTVTPEVAVVVGDGQMVYRGRIDDRYVDFGRDRPAPTTRDLERVLTALAAGETVAPSTTRAVGCYLPELVK
jgi:hypothetical protein